MTDYIEEQNDEIEALQSIYLDDFQVLEEEPWSFTVYIECDSLDGTPEYEICTAVIRFTLASDYPDTLPQIEIIKSENLSDDDTVRMIKLMKEQAEENSGTVMVFTLLSSVKDMMNAIAESKAQQKEDEIQKLKRAAEERDKAIRLGTPVTVATFLEWKINFDKDQLAFRKPNKNEDGSSIKLTGRQLFERDSSLKTSDASFLQDGDVKFDESLFEDMEDLDIEDD